MGGKSVRSKRVFSILFAMGVLASVTIVSTTATADVNALGRVKLQCLEQEAPKAAELPERLRVGIQTIHRDEEMIVSVYVPIPSEEWPGHLVNTNTHPAPLPSRFVMGDGGVEMAFVGVDARKGTLLSRCLDEIIASMPSSHENQHEAVFKFLTEKLEDYLRPFSDRYEFPWTKGLREGKELKRKYKQAGDQQPGHEPIETRQTHPVVPLEEFMRVGHGNCVHKALTASLILSRLHIPHRLVNGATDESGHVWVQLEDGRILDPTWQVLEKPTRKGVKEPGWFKYSDTEAFENDYYPILVFGKR